jgi:hypothetical protein
MYINYFKQKEINNLNSSSVLGSCLSWEKQCCGSESGSESERIQAFLARTKSKIFVPDSDSDSDPDSVPDPVPDPVI